MARWGATAPLIIHSIELREIRLPLVHFFETSFGRTTERRIILARVIDRDGAEGWGECTAGEGPFYSEEWTETAWATLKSFLAPAIVDHELENAAAVFDLMRRVRGHRMAKAAIETACWDLEAKCASLPLWKHLGGSQSELPCGVSIGIQDSPETLLQKIEKELAAGYQRIKIKIKPGLDVDIVRRVREHFPEIRLMGDANSAYTLADVPLFKTLDEFNLMMIEQPLAHDDVFDHAKLQNAIKTGLFGRVDQDSCGRLTCNRARGLSNHQCKTGTGGWTRASKTVGSDRAQKWHSGVVWRNAGIGRWPRAQHCDGNVGRVFSAGRHFGKLALLA